MAKPTIVTRASKGSALTWTEGDSNFTNLRDATLSVTDGTNTKALNLNDTLTFTAGTNVTLSVNATTGAVTINNSMTAFNPANPGAIGGTTAAAGTFTALTATGTTTLATSLGGILKATAGVISAATAGIDYVAISGALGTPSSGTVTNLTGTASININGTVGATTPTTGSFTSISSSTSTTIKDLRETIATVTYASTITPNVANGTVQTVTLTGNVTFSAFASPVTGQSLTLIIVQDATGSRTLTSTMKFSGASKTLSTAANSIDIMTVFYDGTNYYASLAKGFA